MMGKAVDVWGLALRHCVKAFVESCCLEGSGDGMTEKLHGFSSKDIFLEGKENS